MDLKLKEHVIAGKDAAIAGTKACETNLGLQWPDKNPHPVRRTSYSWPTRPGSLSEPRWPWTKKPGVRRSVIDRIQIAPEVRRSLFAMDKSAQMFIGALLSRKNRLRDSSEPYWPLKIALFCRSANINGSNRFKEVMPLIV